MERSVERRFLFVITIFISLLLEILLALHAYYSAIGGDFWGILPAFLFLTFIMAGCRYHILSIREEGNLKRLNAKLIKRNKLLRLNIDFLKVLLEIREIISISQDTDIVLKKISQHCKKKMQIEPQIFLISEDRRKLELRTGSDSEISELNSELWVVYTTGEPFYIAHSIENKNFSYYIMPLKINSQVVGVVSYFFNRSVQDFTRIVLNLAPLITREIESAIRDSNIYQKTLRCAERDELTGLYNYRYMKNKLAKLFTEYKKGYVQSFGLMILDIDNFKYINDSGGHLYGDKILEEIALYIKESVRKEDVVCRYGGDEFAVIMPGINDEGISEVTSRLEKIVSKNEDINILPAISIGVAVTEKSMKTWKDLFEKADRDLYWAKKHKLERKENLLIKFPLP